MVTKRTEKRAKPRYDLEEIRRLAAAGKVAYVSATNVERCLARLDYSRQNLLHCIEILQSRDFQESVRYSLKDRGLKGHTPWMDVYRLKTTYRPDDDPDDEAKEDDLYIKLSLGEGSLNVWVHSFHEWDRWL